MLGKHLGATLPESADFSASDDDNEILLGGEKRLGAERIHHHCQIVLRPSSSSQRNSERVQGQSKDVSSTGCGLLCSTAPRVGDLYRFEVPEDKSHPVHGVDARCVRCNLVDEDAFNAGFCFLRNVDMQFAVDRETNPIENDPLA